MNPDPTALCNYLLFNIKVLQLETPVMVKPGTYRCATQPVAIGNTQFVSVIEYCRSSQSISAAGAVDEQQP